MQHISEYTNMLKILHEDLETSQIEFEDCQNELDRAMKALEHAKVGVAQAQKALKDYEENGDRPDTQTF